jgi:hypothetical protein
MFLTSLDYPKICSNPEISPDSTKMLNPIIISWILTNACIIPGYDIRDLSFNKSYILLMLIKCSFSFHTKHFVIAFKCVLVHKVVLNLSCCTMLS